MSIREPEAISQDKHESENLLPKGSQIFISWDDSVYTGHSF